MFVKVRFGDSKVEIFNPNCRTIVLLKDIQKRCFCPSEDIELSDESGNIKHLRDSPFRYASDFLSEREVLILLRVNKTDGSTSVSFTPLLNDEEAINDDFLANLTSRTPGRDKQRLRSGSLRSPVDKDSKGSKVKGKERNPKLERLWRIKSKIRVAAALASHS